MRKEVQIFYFTYNLTWQNKAFCIHTPFLVVIVNRFLSCWKELHEEIAKFTLTEISSTSKEEMETPSRECPYL